MPQRLIGAAAAGATDRVPTALPGQSVAEVRSSLEGQSFDCVEDVAVVEGSRLRGIVPLRRLLAAEDGALIADIMDSGTPVVAAGALKETAVLEAAKRGQSSIAVTDSTGTFIGLIPAHRMIATLLTEHDEDVARLGGYLASTNRARLAAEEPVTRRLWHRLPWLMVGLIGAMASAAIVGSFESQLDEIVLLAFFLPAVVYMADAVGTQTETVLIRGLAVGIEMRSVVRRELLTGAIIGVAIGFAFFPFVLVGWGDVDIALAVALALFASCSIATLVAMVLPWLLQRLGRDPAFGSGPVATIVQDLLSIAVYLGLATAIVD